ARSGNEAHARLAEGGVDLLVTDVMMPEIGGVQTAATLRSLGAHTPILLMTGRRDPWIAESVAKLQCADLLHKPFSLGELVERARALLARSDASPISTPERSDPHLFPPALVPLLRAAVGAELVRATDDELTELLTVVFFAGLETEEGERNPVRVVFVDPAAVDAEPAVAGVPPPLFRWSTLRFTRPRELSVAVLVKLAATLASGREYVQVSRNDGRGLVVTGLAREGVNLQGDAALKIVVDKPGGLSIRIGRHHVLDYEHGRVQAVATAARLLSGGPVRRALERAAASAGVRAVACDRYLDVVRRLVAELSTHGRGGILVFDRESPAALEGESGFRTHADVSLAAMLVRLDGLQAAEPAGGRESTQMLAGALQAEIQHSIAEMGALTALDGATVLDARLALAGFGVILPVGDPHASVEEAEDVEAARVRRYDLGAKGTRHRAAATYAWQHPDSVVFVASQDGDLLCFLRGRDAPSVTLWRFRTSDLHG
ncbi:MAG TPA: response regulator, partial [Minicystis sp.]|nr:response regulator [Minicystis sp.]